MTEEIKKIQRQFNDVIAYSQTGIDKPDTDDLFQKWLEAKRDIIEVFGGKYIVEYPEPVTFTLTHEEREERVKAFCAMVSHMSTSVLADFIQANSEGFFDNKVIYQYDSSAFKIPKGMKLVKAFKFFESDPEVLNKIQSAASMLIQENSITGHLCLSVHPLDYLSASENNHNWRSCHALDGDYRAGNLSYMVDSSTIVCYLKSKNDEILPNFPESVPWNSKKWRVFLYLSNDWKALFAGRQYPFNSMQGMNFVKDGMLPNYIGSYYSWVDTSFNTVANKLSNDIGELRTRYPYIIIGGYVRPLHQVVINNPDSLQFNDLLSSSTYTPMYAHRVERDGLWYYPSGFSAEKDTTVYVGGRVNCLCCGGNHIQLNGSMMCFPCELEFGDCDDDSIEVCPCCGDRYIYDDGIYIETTDTVICPDCAASTCSTCDVCGELIPDDYIHYDEEKDTYICSDCLEYRQEQAYLNAEYEKERL